MISAIGKTSETAAIASSPSRLTKYVCSTFEIAAISITAVVGAASATIARSGLLREQLDRARVATRARGGRRRHGSGLAAAGVGRGGSCPGQRSTGKGG